MAVQVPLGVVQVLGFVQVPLERRLVADAEALSPKLKEPPAKAAPATTPTAAAVLVPPNLRSRGLLESGLHAHVLASRVAGAGANAAPATTPADAAVLSQHRRGTDEGKGASLPPLDEVVVKGRLVGPPPLIYARCSPECHNCKGLTEFTAAAFKAAQQARLRPPILPIVEGTPHVHVSSSTYTIMDSLRGSLGVPRLSPASGRLAHHLRADRERVGRGVRLRHPRRDAGLHAHVLAGRFAARRGASVFGRI